MRCRHVRCLRYEHQIISPGAAGDTDQRIMRESLRSLPSGSGSSSSSSSLVSFPRITSRDSSTGRPANPLQRLSEQMKKMERIKAEKEYLNQPFKTLNTPRLLQHTTKDTTPTTYYRPHSLQQDSKTLPASRSLEMKSDLERFMDSRALINSRSHDSFAERYYFQQHWQNKDRGGPITRKYSGEGQSLLQRYRSSQKDFHSGKQLQGTTVEHAQRALQYQEQCKHQLSDMDQR